MKRRLILLTLLVLLSCKSNDPAISADTLKNEAETFIQQKDYAAGIESAKKALAIYETNADTGARAGNEDSGSARFAARDIIGCLPRRPMGRQDTRLKRHAQLPQRVGRSLHHRPIALAAHQYRDIEPVCHALPRSKSCKDRKGAL